MSRRSKRGFLVVMSMALVVCMSVPALAGSFGWNVRFQESVKSRSWSAGSGDQKITTSMNCHGDSLVRSYQVRLARERFAFPDVISDWANVPCGQTKTLVFAGWPKGDYHFELRKNGTSSTYWDGSGTMKYPN